MGTARCPSSQTPQTLDIVSASQDDKAPPFPYLEAPVKQAAVGFSVHSGWSAIVAVYLEKGSPAVFQRERVHLVEEFTYKFRQPYHTAEKMPLSEAREFIAKVRATAGNLALRTIRALQERLDQRGYQLSRGALLLASGKPLPELEKILASHALIHTADGELFRNALADARARCGLGAFRVKERELLGQAAQKLGESEAVLLRRVTEWGRSFGSPWSRDEKFAALAAWLALEDNKQSGVSA
jgi:hypothetical protein